MSQDRGATSSDGLGPPRASLSRAGYGGRRGFRGGRPPGARTSRGVIFGVPAPVDQRLSTSEELVKNLAILSKGKPERPCRPEFGTLGQAITLRSNFFATTFPDNIIYDYHVHISPTVVVTRIKERLFTLLEQSNHPELATFVPFIAHDRSARVVASKPLPQPLEVPIVFSEEGQTPREGGKTYIFTIMLTQELDPRKLKGFLNSSTDSRNYNFEPLISAYKLVLQYHASHTGARIGKTRYFFQSADRELRTLSTGIEACKGFFISARPFYKEMMVNVDVCTTAFHKPGNLADRIQELIQNPRGVVAQQLRIIRGLKVTTRHLGFKQTRVLRRIAETNAKTTTFLLQGSESSNISVEQYFRQKYNITLRYPHLPLVDISGPNAKFSVYMPPELCEIEPGQPLRGRLNDGAAAQMVRFTCNEPVVNANAIVNRGLPTLGLTQQTAPQTFKNFGLTVSTHMTVIPGRELPRPRLSYSAGKPATVNNGSWNILDVKFHVGGVIKTWWVLVVQDGRPVFSGPGDEKLIEVWRGFGNKCRRSGMKLHVQPSILKVELPPPDRDPGRRNALDQIRQTIRNYGANGKPTFILVLLSSHDSFIYPGIKRLCDIEFGIHTLHMQTYKVLCSSKQDQYFSNVALKLNTKLGGINHKLDPGSLQWLTARKTMLVGMDVIHLGSGLEGVPSIAGVVASVDSNFVQYPVSLRCQEQHTETITELSAMMVECLERYQDVSKSLPERIFVFRHGLSEGWFDVVLTHEVPKILDSFKRVSPVGDLQGQPYRPFLSIIVSSKRRHMKFWPDRSECADRNGNPRRGSVVDHGVTSVFDFDFYLQAHAPGLQGHVKPTHYTVLYDENKLSANAIQQGINTSCYLYARATRVISVMPPAYYASLACKHGRHYLSALESAEDRVSTVMSDDESDSMGTRERAVRKVYENARKMWGEGVHKDLRDSMFYV